MSRKYVFTKQFFNLSSADQAAVVDAALHDLESALAIVHPADRRSIRQSIKRVKSKAIEYGVYEEEVKS